MSVSKTRVVDSLKTLVGFGVLVGFFLGSSYCSEAPKYRFERTVQAAAAQIPGMRVLTSFQSGDLMSPLSWFWPATTTWNFAAPDPTMADRFYTMTFVYGEKDLPWVWLVDAYCEEKSSPLIYTLDEPESAPPARTIWGEPVVAPNGKTYRLSKKAKIPDAWMPMLCETDWKPERTAIYDAIAEQKTR